MAIGRISGPLLKSNLLRDGVDLAFETDLLKLDVTNRRIGINTAVPQYELDVVGTTRSSNLEVGDELTIGNFTIFDNTIRSDQNTISFVAAAGEATAYHSRLIVNDIEISGNLIATTVSNSNLELKANGTGRIDIQNNTRITGNLDVNGNITATGNIQIDGNLIIGDAITDTITINASLNSSLIPETTNTYDIGSTTYRWRNVYARDLAADTLNLSTFNVGNMIFSTNTITTTVGQNLVLDANGSGSVRLGHFSIRDNTITNYVGSITEIVQTSASYFRIQGTNGFVPPRGNTSERPTAYAVAGMTRYNTDSRALEIWDDVFENWVSPAGTIGAVSESTANDIAIQIALTIG